MKRSHPPTSAPSTILTIGHSNRSWEEFLRLLQAHDVTFVADVRKMPGSRRNEHFNQAVLSQALHEVGIGYAHSPALGGLRRRQKDSPNGGWKSASFQGYADYMLTDEFKLGLEELLEQARGQRAVLMCAEAVPWRCHRSLIADALTVRGIRVEHIFTSARTQSHMLRSWAQCRGERIIYPPQPTEKGPDVHLVE